MSSVNQKLSDEFFARYFRFGGTIATLQRLLTDDVLMNRWIRSIMRQTVDSNPHGVFSPVVEEAASRVISMLGQPPPGTAELLLRGLADWEGACVQADAPRSELYRWTPTHLVDQWLMLREELPGPSLAWELMNVAADVFRSLDNGCLRDESRYARASFRQQVMRFWGAGKVILEAVDAEFQVHLRPDASRDVAGNWRVQAREEMTNLGLTARPLIKRGSEVFLLCCGYILD